jgi:hypothetical protein
LLTKADSAGGSSALKPQGKLSGQRKEKPLATVLMSIAPIESRAADWQSRRSSRWAGWSQPETWLMRLFVSQASAFMSGSSPVDSPAPGRTGTSDLDDAATGTTTLEMAMGAGEAV